VARTRGVLHLAPDLRQHITIAGRAVRLVRRRPSDPVLAGTIDLFDPRQVEDEDAARRFTALASHYLPEACFCRPGEGHDKGGVESRGKAVRHQALVPIPVGATLAVINTALLAQMDARLDTARDAAGQTIGARFVEEQRACRPTPVPSAPEATTFGTVSPRALVRLERAYYSVPCRWAGLDLIVRPGATTVTIIGREETQILPPRLRFG